MNKKKYARLISQFEEQHGLQLGDIRVFALKLRLRISNVNLNWINFVLAKSSIVIIYVEKKESLVDNVE